jgi:hypothetical protein
VIYDISEHRHRFAVWAAARATQRGFTTVGNLREAIEATSLRAELSNAQFFQTRTTEFEHLHRKWCLIICSFLDERQIAKATYGRAAKLIAVYLKATVILGNGADTPLGQCIHPPIDRILLRNLAANPRIKSPDKVNWRKTNWTDLNQVSYFDLVAQLRKEIPDEAPFWMLEEYWNVTNADV